MNARPTASAAPVDLEPMLDTEAAAHAIGATPSLLIKFRSTGEGPPFVKMGHLVRYRPADLRDWLAANVRLRNATRSRRVTLPRVGADHRAKASA